MAQSEAQSTMEKLCSQSQKYSINSNDALVTLCGKAFETTAIVLSPASDKARMDLAITSLDNDRKLIFQSQKNGSDALRDLSLGLVETIQVLLEDKGKNIEEQNLSQVKLLESDGKLKRAVEMAGEYKARVEVLEKIIDTKEGIIGNANGAESIDELKNKVAELTKQLEEERKGRMRDQERFEEDQPTIMREPPPSPTGSQLAIVDGCLGESIFKKEEMDFDFEVDNANPIEEPSDEQPSNDADSHGNMVPSDVMGEDMNPIEDPDSSEDEVRKRTRPTRTSSRLYSESDDDSEPEVKKKIGEANVSIEQKEEKDNATEDASKSGEAEKRKRTSKSINYTESLDESEEPLEKKPRSKSEKKIDNKRRSDRKDKGDSDQAELECPKCEVRLRSAISWCLHLGRAHSTTPRELGLALLCDCGHESFSAWHSRECKINNITVVRKSATPKCVMKGCKEYPATARGYTAHLARIHNTTLIEKGIFLVCACGDSVRSNSTNPNHSKKCNHRKFTLHKVDDE